MTGCRFVLALPRNRRRSATAVKRVNHLTELCGDAPALWIAEDTSVASLGTSGWLIGVAMEGGGATRIVGFPNRGERSVVEVAAELIANVWGAYVAILLEPGGESVAVLPDPSGHLPIYRQVAGDHILISCDARLLAEVNKAGLTVDWCSLRAFLLRPELRQRQTCLADVDELAPGTLVWPAMLEAAAIPVWRAQDFLPSGPAPDSGAAAEELAAIASLTIGAWSDHFGSVAVAASGGIDSSLICAALTRGEKSFGCVTLATPDRSGDERGYARELAAHLKVPLAERVYDPDRFDPLAIASAGLPRPGRRSFLTMVDNLLADGAASLAKNIVFDGNGGDNLFCFLHSAAPVVDRIRVEGIGRGAFATLLDMCRVTGCDVPTMIASTGRRLSRKPRPVWLCDRRLLANDIGADPALAPLTEWLDVEAGRHGGKRDHLALIMRAQHHTHGLGPGPARFSPLMSQPLLEFCLRVPTWLWAIGGRNRALARAAFADDLPAPLLARTSKAGPDSIIRRAFDVHRDVLRELLLEGLLAQHGLMDLSKVEDAFSLNTAHADSLVYRLLDLAEAENWARSWR